MDQAEEVVPTSQTNQTEFFSEQAFLAQPQMIEPDKPVIEKPMPWFKKKQFLIAIPIVIVVLLLIIIVAVAMMPKNRRQIFSDQTTQPSPSPVLTPYQEKIEALKTELQAADPSKQDQPFPPVLLDIALPAAVQQQ